MRDRRFIRAFAATGFLTLLLFSSALAYTGSGVPGAVNLFAETPIRCDDETTVTATVYEEVTLNPLESQAVTWQIMQKQSPNDTLDHAATTSDPDGETSVILHLGEQPGPRIIKATAGPISQTTVITCNVDGLPPTSAPAPTGAPLTALAAGFATILLGLGIIGLHFARR